MSLRCMEEWRFTSSHSYPQHCRQGSRQLRSYSRSIIRIGGWVGSRTSFDAVENLIPCRGSNPSPLHKYKRPLCVPGMRPARFEEMNASVCKLRFSKFCHTSLLHRTTECSMSHCRFECFNCQILLRMISFRRMHTQVDCSMSACNPCLWEQWGSDVSPSSWIRLSWWEPRPYTVTGLEVTE
jgi:hypothetical protein